MRPVTIINFTTYLLAGLLLVGSTGLVLGFVLTFAFRTSPMPTEIRVPLERTAHDTLYVPVEGELTRGNGVPSAIVGNWSSFRGENRNAVSTEATPLRKNWSDAEPPPVLWGLPLGEGFAGFAVRNGRVYVLDYDAENQRDTLRCLSLDDGQEIWRYSYPVKIKKNHGMSRTIPAVTDQYCISLGPKCHVLCVDAVTGEEKWLINLRHEYETTEPDWYAGQCPLIVTLPGRDRPSVILAPVGPEALMVALDCETKEEVWRTPNPFGWNMTHTSIMPMMLDEQLTFVYHAGVGLVGVRATDGEILWSWSESSWPNAPATCSSPTVLPDNRIFFSGAYRRGSVMIQVEPDPQTGKYKAVTCFQLDHTVFDTEQQTPIFYAGHIFGLRQNDKQFVCLDLDGRVVWESGRREKFGSGPSIVADGMILILDDDSKLTGIGATPAGFRKLFEVEEVLDDVAGWAPMAIVEGHLLLRDQFYMRCLDLR
jgi:outer membrane protein assembly factor BamB